ncbi:hypothetical protein F5882DRAFT_376287 [Hyaloscypha sp. PMI_1271]|nr:hypothetical protein F5882DRAFT_376287 [Hyaloscypha sp. PMI_1271]
MALALALALLSLTLTLALTVTVTRLCRAEILNNQPCARYSLNDAMACGVYGVYGQGTTLTSLPHSLSHSAQCAAEEDKREQRCRGRRGESNRSSLLKRVSAFCVQKSPETCHAEQKEVRQIVRPRTPSPLRHWP